MLTFPPSPAHLAPTLDRLRSDQIDVPALATPQQAFVDGAGSLHGDMSCWEATSSTLVSVDALVATTDETVSTRGCACGGWRSLRATTTLAYAKMMYEVVDGVWPPAAAPSFWSAADLFGLLWDDELASAGLGDLHHRMASAATAQLDGLRGALDPTLMVDAVAAHGALIPVRAEDGPLLHRWAREKTVEHRPTWSPAARAATWLCDRFDPLLRAAVAASPRHRFLVAAPAVSTPHLLLWAMGADVIEPPLPSARRASPRGGAAPSADGPHSRTVYADAVLPEVVAEGVRALRGAAVRLEQGDDPMLCAVVASLHTQKAAPQDLCQLVGVARTLVAPAR